MVTQEQKDRYARWEAQNRHIRIAGNIALFLGGMIVALTLVIAFDTEGAMKKCQAKGNSYDTCFTALHR